MSKVGVVHYSKPEMLKMWDMNTGKFTGWRDYDLRDFFPDPANLIPEIWSDYEEQVEEELEERGEDENSESEEDDEGLGIEKHFRIKTIAEQLDLHPETIRRKCKREEIDYNKVQGEYRIPKSEVEALVN